MSTVLVSLGLGLALIVVANLALARRMGGGRAALTVTLLTLLMYVPYAVFAWPGGDVFAIHLALYLVVNLGFAMLWRSGGAGAGGAWGPAVIVGFFLLIASANTVFLLLSEQGLSSGLARLLLPTPRGHVEAVTSQFPGTMAPGTNTRQRLYDRHIEKLDAQGARGWTIRKGWMEPPVEGKSARFRVAVEDAEGRPVAGARIDGDFLRLSDRHADQRFTMRELQRGVYQAEVSLPNAGTWSLWLRVRTDEASHELRATTTVGTRVRADARIGS